MELNPRKAAYSISLWLEVSVYKKLEVITESTSPDIQLSGLSPHALAHRVTWQFTQVSTLQRWKTYFL